MTPARTTRAEGPTDELTEVVPAPAASTTIETKINMVIGCYIFPHKYFTHTAHMKCYERIGYSR